MSPQLKLIALDTEDLAVIAAHVQDARVQTSDIVWRQSGWRSAMNRLDWEQTLAGETLAAPPDRGRAFRPIWARNDEAPPGRAG